MTQTPFDPAPLVAEFGDEDFVVELLELMLQHVDQQLATVHAAIAQGDAAALKAAAHKLKGGMGTFQVPEITSRALALETLGREGTVIGAEALATALSADVHDYCERARTWLARRAA